LLQSAVGACTQNLIKPETDCCKIEHFTAVFCTQNQKGSGRNGKAKPHQSGAILSHQ